MTTRDRFRGRLFRAAALGVAALAVASAAACGSGSGSGSGGPVALEYWHRLPVIEGARTVADLVNQYNAETPNVRVTATTMQGSASDSYPKIASAVQSGTAPCLAQVGVDRVPDLLSSGQLLDVTDQVSGYADQYLPYAWNMATFEGRTYGVPQDTGPVALYYRKDLFDRYGIPTPKTWAEYRAAGEKLKAADPQLHVGNLTPGGILGMAAANGAKWWSLENGAWKVDIDSPQTRQVTDYWQGLFDDGLITMLADEDPAFKQQLADGRIASLPRASWFAPLLASYAPATAGKWAVAPMPQFNPDGRGAVAQEGGSIVAVLAGCQQPKEAVDFANWLNNQTADLLALGLTPATKEERLATPADLQKFYGGQPIFDQFVAANERAPQGFTWAPAIADTMTGLEDGGKAIANGGPPLSAVVSDAQKTSVASLERAGIPVAR